MTKRFGVIVDGYSTGAGLVKKFAEYGISCIHVQSQLSIPRVYAHTYQPNDYANHCVFSGDVQSLSNNLQSFKPEFVIAGAECGIELADSLCEALLLPGNGKQLSASRRNKYLMWQEVESRGIQVIPSFLAKTLEEAIDWVVHQQFFPVIVKPVNSAGGEGVTVCKSITELSAAFTEVISLKTNMLGFGNQGVLIQHYIEGKEYVVNTVSYAGNHKFCELWEYTRYKLSTGQQIYDTAKAISFDVTEHGDVIDYAIQAIEALGIQYGAAHVEIIKNEKGCFLIEVGARLMGANLPFSLLEKSITTPQANYTVMAYADPSKFMEHIGVGYELIRPFAAVFMISKKSGTINAINFLSNIRALQSYYDMKLAIKIGDTLHKTIDYQTSPGMIYLSHEDDAVIENDIQTIRMLEEKMFFLQPVSELLEEAVV